MTAVDGAKAVTQPQPQSAAAPSPFPPIASYGFLSNCHTKHLSIVVGFRPLACADEREVTR